MSKNISVNYENKPCYNILIRESFEDLEKYFDDDKSHKYNKVCIVTDSNVSKLYLKNLYQLLESKFNQVITFGFEAGEGSKKLSLVEILYEQLIKNQFDRHDLLIALGGGVVGDMTGFCAATYLRGIDFIQVPTTLLSQVDSSIGGKTGVDFMNYKNMVGAFYMPKLVYINLEVIKTLPKEQFQSGMGEIIKHGCIMNQSYFQWLRDYSEDILSLNHQALEEMIYQSCLIKRDVVEKDPKEQNIRAYLNFGHTIGHAVEKLSNFQLFHGQCVAIGIVAAAYLSVKKNMISHKDYENLIDTLNIFGLPVSIHSYGFPLTAEDILLATKSDKKMNCGQIKFILLQNVGEAVSVTTLSDEDILEAIQIIM